MEDLLSFIVTEITGDKPQSITSKTEDGIITYTITVPKEQMGVLIGKGGRVIFAIRTLARVRAAKENTQINIELQEET